MTNHTKLFSCTKNRPSEPPCLTLASVIAFALMLFPASFEVEQRGRIQLDRIRDRTSDR